jgi:hypothetical protein
LGFDSRQRIFFHSIKIGSGAHTASYTIRYREIFPVGQNRRGVKLTTHLHLVPRLRICRLFLDSFNT